MILISGPCVIESESLTMKIAESLKKQLNGLPVDFYFKASFDKANRTSIDGFRGPGIKDGLKLLGQIKKQFDFKLLTDFHSADQAEPVAEVVDMIQVPAFLCRQTDIIAAGAKAAISHGKRLNIKKGQFLAPWDAKNIIEKVRETENKMNKQGWTEKHVTLTERGTSFGYNRLVVDMISFQEMQKSGVSVIYDATHSIQLPGAAPGGKSTGGARQYLEVLARAALAAGADGLFMEVHPNPSQAKSDGPNAFYLDQVGEFLRQCLEIKNVVRDQKKLLPEAKV